MVQKKCVLIADDGADDVFLLTRAFESLPLGLPLQTVLDGEQAIQYLSGKDQFADRTRYPVPDLLLLDLKMPKVNGFEVLQWVRDHELKVPVVILSGSNMDADVQKALALGAVAYCVKPIGYLDLVEIVQDLTARWLS